MPIDFRVPRVNSFTADNNKSDSRQKSNNSLTVFVWSVSGVVFAACSGQNMGHRPFKTVVENIEGARLYADFDGDGLINSEHFLGITDSNGEVTIDGNYADSRILVSVQGATYLSTGEALSGNSGLLTFEALPGDIGTDGSVFISPLTDMLAEGTRAGLGSPQEQLDAIFGAGRVETSHVTNPDNYFEGLTSENDEIIGSDATDALIHQLISRASVAIAVLRNDPSITSGGSGSTEYEKLQDLFADFRALTDQNINNGGGPESFRVALNPGDLADAVLRIVSNNPFSGDSSGMITEDASPNTVSGTIDFDGAFSVSNSAVVIMVRDNDGTDMELTASVTSVTVSGEHGSMVVMRPNDNSGTLTWTYTLDNTEGDVQALALGAHLDDEIELFLGTSAQNLERGVITIRINGANDPVTRDVAIEAQTVAEDADFNFAIPQDAFADVDNDDALTYSVALTNGNDLPDWLSFDEVNGIFSGTPDNEDVGSIEVRVTATDGGGVTATSDFMVTVTNTPNPPNIGAMGQISLHDTQGDDDFDNSEGAQGEFGATDPDIPHGDTLRYIGTVPSEGAGGDTGATPDTSVAGFDHRIVVEVDGITYGNLYYNSGTGAYRFIAIDEAIEGLGSTDEQIVFEAEITVIDSDGLRSTQLLSITITGANDIPTINGEVSVPASHSVRVDNPFSYTLPENAFTDRDVGDTLTYSATLADGSALPAWLSFDPATRELSGTPSSDASDVIVRFTATDSGGASVSLDTAINVVTIAPPSIVLGATSTSVDESIVSVQDIISLTLSDDRESPEQIVTTILAGTTGENEDARFELVHQGSGAFTLQKADGVAFDHETEEQILVRIRATDLEGEVSTSEVITIDINDVNDAPQTYGAIANYITPEDTQFRYTVPLTAFTDEDEGDSLTYSATLADGSALPGWLSFNPVTRYFEGTPSNSDVGVSVVHIIVTDSSGATAYHDTILTVVNVNDAPTLGANPIGAQTATEDSLWSYTIADDAFADEDEGDVLTYQVFLITDSGAVGLPSWLTFDGATGTFEGTPTNDEVGTLSLHVIASDQAGAARSRDFFLTINNVNDDPSVGAAIADQSATENTLFSFVVPEESFEDIDPNEILTYTATLADGAALPSWLSFDGASRTFEGTPADSDVGALEVRVTVTDSGSVSVYQDFTLTVSDINNAPVINSDVVVPDSHSALIGERFSYTLPQNVFSDEDEGDTLTLTAHYVNTDGTTAAMIPATSTESSWLGFDATTGELSGVPLVGANRDVVVRFIATDTSSASVSLDTTLNIINDPAPVITLDATSASANENFESFQNILTLSISDNRDSASQLITSVLAGETGETLDERFTLTDQGSGAFRLVKVTGAVLNYEAETDGQILVRIRATDLDGGSSTSEVITIDITDNNDAPTVGTAIGEVTVNEHALFNFVVPQDAFADEDEGDSLTYTATLVDGSAFPSWLSFDGASRTFSGTPGSDDAGSSLEVRVTATDSGSLSVSQDFTLSVANINDAPSITPSATSGLVYENAEAFHLILSLGITDDHDSISDLTFTILAGTTGETEDTRFGVSDFGGGLWGLQKNAGFVLNHEAETNGQILVRVRATDSHGESSTSEVITLNVRDSNDAPTVGTALTDQTANEGDSFDFTVPQDAFADEDEGNVFTYSATLADGSALPSWLSFDGASGAFSGTPGATDGGEISVRVTATDSGSASVYQDFTLSVTTINNPPSIGTAIANQVANQDAAFSFTVSQDAFTDTDSITYSATLADGSALPSWLSFDGATRTFSGTPSNADSGSVAVRVIATDTTSLSAHQDFTLVVNTPPSITLGGTSTSAPESVVSAQNLLTFSVSDDRHGASQLTTTILAGETGDTADGRFSLVDQGAGLMVLRKAANVVLDHETEGQIFVRLSITDLDGATTVTEVITINVNDVNEAPTAGTTIADQTTNQDADFSFTVSEDAFADEDEGDSLTYSATLADGSALPAWLSFDGATRTFSGTPSATDSGSIEVRVTATDNDSLSTSQDFTLTVNTTNTAPTEGTAIADQTANEDATFSFTVLETAFVDEGDTLTYSATLADGSALPSWLSFDDASRTFSGTPLQSDVGSLEVRVTVTDSGSLSASQDFTLTVNNVNDAPTEGTAIADQTANEDAAFSFTFAQDAFADEDEGEILTYSATLADGSALPSWLSFDGATRTFSGTPANEDVGSLEVRVTATDSSSESASQDFTLSVNNVNDAPQFVEGTNTYTGSVTEDETLTATGNILFSDDDDADSAIGIFHEGSEVTSVSGDYGRFDFTISGDTITWTYTLDNTLAAVQVLNAGDTLPDSLAITLRDDEGAESDSQTLSITINGANEISVSSVFTQSSETAIYEQGDNTISGSLIFTDSLSQSATAIADTYSGTYGTLTLSGDGSYSYERTASEATFDGDSDGAFVSGESLSDTISLRTTASNGEIVSTDITFTINGLSELMDASPANENTLAGTAAHEIIQGGNQGDTLSAGGGDDILIGGYGIDTINLGDGAETIIWRFNSDATSGEANEWRAADGSDTINNFRFGVDKLVLVDEATSSPITSFADFIAALPQTDTVVQVIPGSASGFRILSLQMQFTEAGLSNGATGDDAGTTLTINFDAATNPAELIEFSSASANLDGAVVTNYDFIDDIFGGAESIEVATLADLGVAIL